MGKNFEVTYKVKKNFGALSMGKTYLGHKWVKELRLISWNGKLPVFDIREWRSDGKGMRKGITLTKSEAKVLIDLLENEV